MFLIVEKGYSYPLFSSEYCYGKLTFETRQEALDYLADSNSLSDFSKSMLKVVEVPSCQEWRVRKTLAPYQLYPLGTTVTIHPQKLNSVELFEKLESHFSPESTESVKDTLLALLRSLNGKSDQNPVLFNGMNLKESVEERKVNLGYAGKVLAYNLRTGYILDKGLGSVSTFQLLPHKSHIFGEMSISSGVNNSLNQLFLC